jgi:hypothetical protein
MKKIVKVLICICLLVAALFIGLVLWKVLNEETLVDYDYTKTYTETDYPGIENVTINYDLCFQNATFIVVDDNPGFLVQIHCKLTVLIPGAKAANPRVSITNSSYGKYLTISITRENLMAPCSLEPGSAEISCEVIIDRDLCVDLDASSGFGNLNLTGDHAKFDTVSLKHGINCPGNTFVNLSDSFIYEDFTIFVSVGTYDITLHNVLIVGVQDISPSGKGTIVIT